MQKLINSISWNEVKLDQVIAFTQKPNTVILSNYSTIPFVPLEFVPLGKLNITQFQKRNPKQIGSGTYFEKGDILLAKITPSFENGKQGMANDMPEPFGYASTEVIPMKTLPNLADKKYIFYTLLNQHIRNELARKMEGSTGRQRLSKNTLKEFKISLPTLRQQQFIAQVLEQVQAVIEVKTKELNLTSELKLNLMNRFFGQLKAPIMKLGEISSISSGGTPSRNIPEYWDGIIPWVTTSEIKYNVILDTKEKITEAGLKNSSTRMIPKNTILMAMYGQGVTRGRVAILGIEAAVNQACAAITVNETINNKYLYHYLTFQYTNIRNMGYGANQKNLNAIIIKSIKIPVTTLEEQNKIAKVLDAIDLKTDAIKNELNALKELFKNIINTFTGTNMEIINYV